MTDIVLYHIPPSFYSQIARIVLVELGIRFQAKVVAMGPPTFESYAPWYMALNPMGTVPTLVHGDHVVPDSDAIVRYAIEHLNAERGSAGLSEAAARWIEALRAISIRELSYGAEDARKLGAKVNAMRLRALEKRRRTHPELADAYAKKHADIRGFADRAVDASVVAEHRATVGRLLDEMDELLASQPWLAGEEYSMADAVWTVGVARCRMLKLNPLEGRPALAAWYERVKARPSFERADVWERFKPLTMLKVVSLKLAPQILAAVAIAVALVWGIVWVLS